jgi:hypothetical protein
VDRSYLRPRSWGENKQKPISTEIKNENGSGWDVHLENLLAISKNQNWNGIHRELGKGDALEQYGDGQW